MKNKLNVYSNNRIKNFLSILLSEYELVFMKLDSIDFGLRTTQANIVIINNNDDAELINSKQLNENFLIIFNLKNKKLRFNHKIKVLNGPVSISHIKNTIENFSQNLKVQFHDICIYNEKLTNLNNRSFCYLTKSELEILCFLIREKEVDKSFIRENILKIKSNIETNSLESHLTRIRKKMNKVKTVLKIQTKSEKLLIKI